MASANACPHVAVQVDKPQKAPEGKDVTGEDWLLACGDGGKVESSSAPPPNDFARPSLLVGVRLVVATIFCLVWNVTGIVIIKTCASMYAQSKESRDESQLVTIVLTAVPFLFVGSILLWMVMAEWWRLLVRREVMSCTGAQHLDDISKEMT